jgi:hypothetical protein
MLCAVFLTGCSTKTVTRFLVVEVPQELREPCLVTARPYETIADIGLILTDHVECLDTSNGRIQAIDEIMTEAEQRVLEPQ